MKGYLMQLQPFSVNDGEGIRTTVFLAGCPLSCKWCSNPEGLDQRRKTGFYERLCIGCGECAAVCPQGIPIGLNEAGNRERCVACGKCAAVCPKGARKSMIEEKNVSEIVAELKKHRLFYQKSGGGVTFSGGEATMQREFLDELSTELYDLGFSLAIETCGLFDFDTLLPILKRMDLIFMDLKHMDSVVHQKYTGVPNDRILQNMKRLGETGAEIIIRIPVIEGVNAAEENIRSSAVYVKNHLPQAKMELLPYHKFGFGKYEALGLALPADTFAAPKEEKLRRLLEIIAESGVEIVDYK